MSTVNYKCPCCGAGLSYSGKSGKLECEACGNAYTTEDMESLEQVTDREEAAFRVTAQTYDTGDDAEMDAYRCKSCGAELICESTVTATACPYCGSPTILPDHIQGGVKPEKVLPFLIEKEQATQMFQNYFQGKKLLPNIFKTGNEIQEIRKLYVPYWLFGCKAVGDVIYDAEKKEIRKQNGMEITTVRHFVVRRRGSILFEDIPVDGSVKLDDKITESLEPYDLSKAVPFQSAVLSGAMADHADADLENCRARAAQRVKTTTESMLRNTVKGYDTVNVRKSSFITEDGTAQAVLMPVWLITTKKNLEGQEKTYTFAINGQTGKLTCDVPYARGKAWAIFGTVFGVFMAAVCGLLAALGKLASGTALLCAVAALIAGLCVVGSMKGKLKTAFSQMNASAYVRKDSFRLETEWDRLLFQKEQRKQLPNQTAKA